MISARCTYDGGRFCRRFAVAARLAHSTRARPPYAAPLAPGQSAVNFEAALTDLAGLAGAGLAGGRGGGAGAADKICAAGDAPPGSPPLELGAEIAAFRAALRSVVTHGRRAPVARLLMSLAARYPVPPSTAETAVLRWLADTSLVRTESTPAAGRAGGCEAAGTRLPSFDRLLTSAASGELLCDVAGYVAGRPVSGVFRPPRTCATSLANIRRASEAMFAAAVGARVGVPHASELECEAELLRGDRVAILSWLQVGRDRGFLMISASCT